MSVHDGSGGRDDGADGNGLAAQAGEYVLGLLGGEERARFERRLGTDPRLRAEVEAWERRLAPLALATEPVEPPPRVWSRIEASLRGAAPQVWVPPVRKARRPLPVGVWRAWALGATAAAAALAGLLVARPPWIGEQPPPVRLIAVLNDAQDRPAFLVSAAPGEQRVSALGVARPDELAGRVPELWALPDGGGAPVSLGLLDARGRIDRALPPAARELVRPGRAVAVSLEPPGGSPTGQPTGPVAYTGVLLSDPF
jgi:anti-sigma-K factor RskA